MGHEVVCLSESKPPTQPPTHHTAYIGNCNISEDDLKILKVEYLSNHWLDLHKILNLSWVDKTQNLMMALMKMSSNKDYLKILKVEYLSNHLLDLPQILYLTWGDQTKIEYCLKLRQYPMEDDLKILKWKPPEQLTVSYSN